MKTYLAKFTMYEGEHVHHKAFMLHATTYEEAFEIARSQEHNQHGGYFDNNDIPEEKLTYWDYGDGTTAAELNEVIEITQTTAKDLEELGLAHYFSREESRQRKRVKCVNNATFEDCLTEGKFYEVEVEHDGGGQGMDMYYLLDDHGEPLNTLAYHFAE